ncbi:MAG: hypothetical protein ACR2OZ_09415 [Verrucomicrobiales bacterium]
MHSSIAALAIASSVILASCVASSRVVSTPYGPLIVDYAHNSDRRMVLAAGQVSRHFSPDANDSLRGFGFSNGYDGEQTLVSDLRLSDGSKKLSLSSAATADLWNLDLESAHYSEVRKIDGLDGYALHGSDGERGYTVVFFFIEDRFVGRLVSTLFQDIFISPSGKNLVLAERD